MFATTCVRIACCLVLATAVALAGCSDESDDASGSTSSAPIERSTTTVAPATSTTTTEPAFDADACDQWFSTNSEGTLPVPRHDQVDAKRATVTQSGAAVHIVGDTYVVTWAPDGWTTDDALVANMHGTGGLPEFELIDWMPTLQANNMAFIGVWWFDETTEDYRYSDDTYATFDTELTAMLDACGGSQPDVLLSGFSRGGAESHGVAAQDLAGSTWFDGVLVLSGGWSIVNPRDEMLKAGGDDVLAGEHVWFWCGSLDDELGMLMCEAEQQTVDWITARGSSVDEQFVTDGADHHDFFQHADAVAAMLAWFNERRADD